MGPDAALTPDAPVPVPVAAPALVAASLPWTLWQRVAFRFLFSYLALYFVPLPSGLTDPSFIGGVLDPVWYAVVPWVAQHALGVSITVFTNGSGDTTYDYVRVGCFLALSVLSCIVWSILDRKRDQYRTLQAWGIVFLRYVLANSMLTYGVSKLVHGQFYDPSYNVLKTPVGDLTPMRLLWTLMGSSPRYEFFGGMGETVGGVLLLFRRSSLLGALVLVGVLSNVLALNLDYDVPVKLGSMHLLLAAMVVAAPHWRRLVKMFVLGMPVEAPPPGPSFTRPWMRRAAVGMQVALIASFGVYEGVQWVDPRVNGYKLQPPLAIESYIQDGVEFPATAPETWSSVRFAACDMVVRRTSGVVDMRVQGDPKTGPLKLFPTDDEGEPVAGAAAVGELRLTHEAPDRTTFEGTFESHVVVVKAILPDRSRFRLLSTGFHWINETPNNQPR